MKRILLIAVMLIFVASAGAQQIQSLWGLGEVYKSDILGTDSHPEADTGSYFNVYGWDRVDIKWVGLILDPEEGPPNNMLCSLFVDYCVGLDTVGWISQTDTVDLATGDDSLAATAFPLTGYASTVAGYGFKTYDVDSLGIRKMRVRLHCHQFLFKYLASWYGRNFAK